ncbi:hypothetical protein GOP47_0003927 [Adiantum capillus-veneris]|uniref:Uncharacterized protein n=1 Tax=Adiantum capillus-veneris TaxID=13818 RepID=A0A9D4V6M0_ADICA|nr:hypothetical protein GOP47_0003927 [Adiantum capillus-veneris]
MMRLVSSPRHLRTLTCRRRRQSARSLNIFSIFSKEAVEKERLRLKEELNRGYFDDYRDMKKHNGKLATASQSLLPATASVKFPPLQVRTINGDQFTIPYKQHVNGEAEEIFTGVPATLICIAFRGHGQGLTSSWVLPFVDYFKGSSSVRVYEVFYIDQWLLSLPPIRYLLLRSMRPKVEVVQQEEFRNSVYAFGDCYDFRKALHITNLLTGYAFLLDEQGWVRWRGFGQSTDEEVKSMISCSVKLLDDQKSCTQEPLDEQTLKIEHQSTC